MRNLRSRIPATCFLSIFICSHAGAVETPSNKWDESAELSVVSTNGNSKATPVSAKNDFTYRWTKSTLEVIGRALGTSEKDATTAEEYFASEELTRTLTGKNYVYEKTAWDKDRFSGIQNQYNLSAGFGRTLLDSAKDKLTSEAGAGYVNEERANAPRNDFGSGRAYAKYVRVLSDTAKFTQDIETLANFKDSDGYRLNTETNLTASISTHMSLKVSYLWKRINQPAPGFGKDTTTTSLSLVVNY